MLRFKIILVSMLVSGCTLMTNEYDVFGPEDGSADDEVDAGLPDGTDVNPYICTPLQATGSYKLLKGPTNDCCDNWNDVCLGENQHYIVLQTDGQFVRWFDRCNVTAFKSPSSTVKCTSAEGYTVSIGKHGRNTTTAPEGFAHTWSLYHRDLSAHEFLAPVDACGQSECEMFSGFQLDAGHRYMVRQIATERVIWYDNCQLADVATSNLDKLTCIEPEMGTDIHIQSSAPESTSVQALKGSWTLFSEPIDNGGNHTYLSPIRGCGDTECPMWDGFDLSADQRYVVLQSGNAGIRWFDSCYGQFDEVTNKKLRCVSSDGHFIELQTQGNETSDVAIDGNSDWSLLRWSLHAN